MIRLKEIDPLKLPRQLLEFAPIACMNCGFDGHISRRFFKVLSDVNSQEEYSKLGSVVKKKLGYDSFTEHYCDIGFLISVCRCPKCGSEEIFEDF